MKLHWYIYYFLSISVILFLIFYHYLAKSMTVDYKITVSIARLLL
ncbi:hypothetical protein MKZ64_00130 [Staphylococcus hominis subsp. hominis]|nr:hypothetical protein [Staphylococcus hominis]MCI3142633.1 hypothetical protein [Staphylococcus hominis subsp. hominis]